MSVRSKLLLAALMWGALGLAFLMPAQAQAPMRLTVMLSCGSMTGRGSLVVEVDGVRSAPITLDCGEGI